MRRHLPHLDVTIEHSVQLGTGAENCRGQAEDLPQSGRHQVFDLLGCYAAYIGSSSPTFRDSLFVPTTTAKKPRKMDTVGQHKSAQFMNNLRNLERFLKKKSASWSCRVCIFTNYNYLLVQCVSKRK